MGRPRFDPRQQQRGFQIRVNHRIRVPEVRVIGSAGEMLGVMQTHEALRQAQTEGLDNLAGASRGALFTVTGTGAGLFDRISSELSGYYLLGVESEIHRRRHVVGTHLVEVVAVGLAVGGALDQVGVGGAGAAGQLRVGSVDAILDYLAVHVTPGSVVALLSNGAFGGIHQKLLARLS